MPITGAFIMPHPPMLIPKIGQGKEAEAQKTIDACHKTAKMIAGLNPQIIVISTPHSVSYSDYNHISPGQTADGDFSMFGEKSISMEVSYDTDFVKELENLAEKFNIRSGTLGEKNGKLDHGVMVPLYFINKYLNEYKIVRIGLSNLSNLDHYRLGKLVGQVAESSGKNVVFLGSGDLSHKLKDEGPYGFSQEGVDFDSQITKFMADGNFLELMNFKPDFCEAAAECGLKSFTIMAGALDGKQVTPEFISYEGPFGVGYGVAAYRITGNDKNRHFDKIFEEAQTEAMAKLRASESSYVRLARETLEHFVKTGKELKLPEELDKELINKKAGVFVSIKKYGQLRGCIGTISPVTNCIANEILRNAICAGAEDPRFHPVEEGELNELVYSVDVLEEPERISGLKQLDVKKYGVIVSSGDNVGLLLPNLDGIETVEDQVRIACEKGGIEEGDEIILERFEVVRHK